MSKIYWSSNFLGRWAEVCQQISLSENVLDLEWIFVGWILLDVNQFVLGNDCNLLNHILQFVSFLHYMDSFDSEDLAKEVIDLEFVILSLSGAAKLKLVVLQIHIVWFSPGSDWASLLPVSLERKELFGIVIFNLLVVIRLVFLLMVVWILSIFILRLVLEIRIMSREHLIRVNSVGTALLAHPLLKSFSVLVCAIKVHHKIHDWLLENIGEVNLSENVH